MTEGAKPKVLDLKIDIDRLTIGDLEVLESPGTAKRLVDILQKAVVETNIRELPLSAIRQIAQAIMQDIQGLQQEKN